MTKSSSTVVESIDARELPDKNRVQFHPLINSVISAWKAPYDLPKLYGIAFECGQLLRPYQFQRIDLEDLLKHHAGARLYNKEYQEQSINETISRGLAEGEASGQPANDNRKKIDLTPPMMHPAPFTPQAAGGLLGDIARHVNDTAIIPVPELALASSIALLSGIFGDRALGPTRSGINLFMTTVMGVASGKGHAPKSIINLAQLAGRPGAVTNGDPTSYAAIERMLRRNKSTVVVMDEFGITLQDVNSRHSGNSASASIRKFILAIYDQADCMFYGRQYASEDTKKDDGPIDGPALTVLGMTTAKTLYEGLTPDSLGNGFLSRFVFLEGTHPKNVSAPKLGQRAVIPSELVERLRNASEAFPVAEGDGNLLFQKKTVVPFMEGQEGPAYQRWAEIFQWQHAQVWSQVDRDINGRAAENTIRLATVRAISRNAATPTIDLDDIEWAWAIVYRSIQVIGDGVSKYMSGSTAEALRKAVAGALSDARIRHLPGRIFCNGSMLAKLKPTMSQRRYSGSSTPARS